MGAATGPPSRRYSIAHLALIVPWVALVIDAWQPIKDNSFLWHIRAGTLQASVAEVLTTDPFSFTRQDERWLTQSWLAELFYGWMEGVTGLDFVPPMLLVTTTLTFVGIGLIAYRRSRSVSGTAFVLVLSTLLLISFLVSRPVVFSYLLFVLVVLAWERPGTRWALPFIFWTWASVHGSFVIGLAYVGLTLIARKEWGAMRGALASGAASLLTAHGLGVVEFLIDLGESSDALALLVEWREPEWNSPVFLPFLGGIVFVIAGAYRQRISYRHLWVLVPFLMLGFSSLRAVPPAWLGMVPLVALSVSNIEIGTTRRLSTTSAVVFAAVVLILPFLVKDDAGLDEDRFPVEASKHLSGLRTFHDDRAGGYLIWAEWPETLVYIDDRAELYGDLMVEYVQVRDGESDWQGVFQREGIEQVLLLEEEELVSRLESAGWLVTYKDDRYVLMRP